MGKSAFLLLAAPVFEAVLAWILIRRKAHRELPLFFIYLIASAVIGVLRFAVSTDYSTYFYVFWTTAAIYSAMILLVLYEVFRWILLDFYRYWTWFWLLFPSAALMAAGVAAAYALWYPPQNGSRLISFILEFSIAVNFIQLVLFALFFGLVWLLELDWWAYSFAVVFGFGISAMGALIGYWTYSTFGTDFKMVVKYGPPMAYIVAVGFWLTVFIRPEPEFKLPPGISRQQLLERVRQDAKVVEWLRRKIKMKTFVLAGILTIFTGLILGRKFYRRVYGLVDPTILDAIPFLTIVNYEQLEALLDAKGEHHLRLNLGEKEFRKAQQKRMKVLLRLVEQINHNARALLAVGRHDRKRGLHAGEPQWQELGQELINAALNVRGGVLAIRLTLHKHLIKSAILPFARAANLASLRSFEGFDLFGAYQRMVDAALELAGAYGDDLRERLASAL